MESKVFPINKTSFSVDHNAYEREYITFAKAINDLKADLIATIDYKKTEKLMFKYGYELGVQDALYMRSKNLDTDELIKQGPVLHSKKGHITGSSYEGYIELFDDGTVKKIQGFGSWHQSFEASYYINHFGISEESVCKMLTGFSTGYLSTILQFDVHVRETTCAAKGDSQCTFEIYSENKEKTHATDAELHTDFDLVEVSNIQNKLIAAITNGATIEDIIKEAEKTFRRTFVIEDIFYNLMYSTTLSEENEQKIMLNMKKFDLAEREQLGERYFKKRQRMVYERKVTQHDSHIRLTNSITLSNKVVAYLSIVSLEPRTFSSQDYLILDVMTNLISMLFLSLHQSLRSQEEAEAEFTDNLFHQTETNQDELLKMAQFFKLDVYGKYSVVVLQFDSNISKIKSEVGRFVRKQLESYRKLILPKSNEINIILYHELSEDKLLKVLHDLQVGISDRFPTHKVRAGYSKKGNHLLDADSHYREASLAVISSSNDDVTAFKDISILSIFINDSNVEHIKQLAKNRFSVILEMKEQKREELMETLYTYLSNNQRLNTTFQQLNISKSGLIYRLDSLKDYLDTDFDDPEENFQLLLLLKAMEISSKMEN